MSTYIGNTKRHGSNNRRKLDGRAERITRAHTFHIVCNGELVLAVISRRINAELVIRPESRFVMTGRHREFAPRVPDTAEIREIEERSSSFFVNHAFELQRAVYIRCQSFTPQVSAGTKFHLTERYCFELGGVGILSSSEQAAKAEAAKAKRRSFFIFRLFYVHKIKKSGSEPPESNPPFYATGLHIYIICLSSQQTSGTAVPPSEALRSPQSQPENKDPPTGRCKAGLLARSSRNAFPAEPVAKECAAIDGTYSSGNCCRISRHSHLITRGLARPFVNHCGAKLKNKFVSLPALTKIQQKIMKHAYVFPGQGAQAVGMGKDLYDNVPEAKELFEKANEISGSVSRTSCSPARTTNSSKPK